MKKGILMTILGTTFWGISGTISQFLFSNYDVNTIWLTSIRMVFAGIILLVIGYIKEKEKLIGIIKDKKDRTRLIIFAIFGLMLCQYSYLSAIFHSNSSTASILQYLNPVFIMLYLCFTIKQWPKKKELFCMCLALLGVFVLVTHGDLHSMVITPTGLFWGIMSGITAAVYSLLPRKIIAKWGSYSVCGYGMLFGGLLLSVLGQTWQYKVVLDFAGYLAVFGIILFGTVLAFTLYLVGVTKIGAMSASLIAAFEPLSATLCMCLWLAVPFTIYDFIGFSLIIITILTLSLTKQQILDSKNKLILIINNVKKSKKTPS